MSDHDPVTIYLLRRVEKLEREVESLSAALIARGEPKRTPLANAIKSFSPLSYHSAWCARAQDPMGAAQCNCGA